MCNGRLCANKGMLFATSTWKFLKTKSCNSNNLFGHAYHLQKNNAICAPQNQNKKLNHFLFKSNYNGIIEIVNKLVIKTEKDDKSINGSRTAHFWNCLEPSPISSVPVKRAFAAKVHRICFCFSVDWLLRL